MKETILAVCGVVGAFIAHAFGGWNAAMATLLIFMGIDLLSGFLVAAVFHVSPKSDGGALESKAMGLVPGELFHALAHPLVAKEGQGALFFLPIRLVAVARNSKFQFRRRQVVRMGMGNEHGAHTGVIQAVLQHMHIGIRPEIQLQLAIDHRAGAGAQFLSPRRPRPTAHGTLAKHGGNPLRRGSAQIQKFHV